MRRSTVSRSALALALLALAACSEPSAPVAARAPVRQPPTAVVTASARPEAAAPVVAEPTPLERAVDGAVAGAIARKDVPGAVVVVLRRGEVALRKAYGDAAVVPTREPMRVDAVFDLASLTKPLATAIAVMQLVEAGRVRLTEPLARHLPDFAAEQKGAVTIEELLLHTSGLPADTPLGAFRGGRAAAISRALATPLEARPGDRTRYSDIGFIALGALVERVSGQRLDAYTHDHVFAPLGLHDTTFRPGAELVARAAPTERRAGEMLRGVVHDPRAAALDGVAGHAGLFASADDVAKIGAALLNGGGPILSRASVEAMLRPRPVPGGARALGWDVAPTFSSKAGAAAISHTGFTGTWLEVDPASGTVAVVLASRLHPDGKGDAKALRHDVAEAVRAWVRSEGSPASPVVASGLDVLEREGFARLAGRRIGLVTNDAVRDRAGATTLQAFARSKVFTLVRVFTPEHGLAARAEGDVGDSKDAASGAPVVSLYGKKNKPARAELADLDALVFDLPSVGARFFTYATTLGLALESAADAKVPIYVLDRAPIGGSEAASGPLLDDDLRSFTGYERLPLRFGMTHGELARFYVAARRLEVDLRVVEIEGYRRSDLGDAGFTPPSPNLRSVDAALLYPGVALLERTNVSVGRGTETPFQLVGAPWIDAAAWAAALASEPVRGVRIERTSFTPTTGPFAGGRCAGIEIRVVDRRALASVELGVALVRALARSHPGTFKIAGVLPMLGNHRAFEALRRGATTADVAATWRADLDAFGRARAAALIYGDGGRAAGAVK